MAKKKKGKVNPGKKSTSTQKQPQAIQKKTIDAGLRFEKGFWQKNWIPAAFLFILACGLYLSSVSYEFVLDDKIVYSENNYVKKGWAGIGDIFSTESFTGYFGEQKDLIEGGRYRPLSLATFAVEYALFKIPGKDKDGNPGLQGNPKVGHLVNILLYAFTGLLLFRVLYLLFPLSENKPWYLGVAFIATLLFVAHPVHSEAVANIKGRDEILTLMGALGALYYCLAYFQKNNPLHLVAAGLCFLIGVFAKENALTFIAVIPLTAYFFTKAEWSKVINATLVVLAVGLFYLFVRTQVIGYLLNPGKEITDIMNNPFYGLNTGEKMATIFYTLGQYVKLLIFPHPLTHDYYPYHVPIMQFSDFGAWSSLLLYLALGSFALWGILKKNVVAYGILFYLITLSIVSNIPFTVGTFMNERFIYMPSVGFCLIIAWLLSEQIPKLKMEIMSYGLLGIMTLGFIAKTITRVPAWENTLTLNSAAIKVSKNSARANTFMGTALFNEYRVEEDQERKYQLLADAEKYINRAVEIHPNYFSALTMKSGVAAEVHKKDRDLNKLLNDFYEILMIRGGLPFVTEYMDYIKARENPEKLVNWCHRVAEGFMQKQDWNNAMKWLQYGEGVIPNHRQMLIDMGKVYEGAGNPAKAQEYFNRAR